MSEIFCCEKCATWGCITDEFSDTERASLWQDVCAKMYNAVMVQFAVYIRWYEYLH